MNIDEIATELNRRFSKHLTLIISADGMLWDKMMEIAPTACELDLNLDAMNEQFQKKGIVSLDDWRETWAKAFSIMTEREPTVIGSREAVEGFLKTKKR